MSVEVVPMSFFEIPRYLKQAYLWLFENYACLVPILPLFLQNF